MCRCDAASSASSSSEMSFIVPALLMANLQGIELLTSSSKSQLNSNEPLHFSILEESIEMNSRQFDGYNW